MKIDLSGKQAIVTGSTAGIGFAIAQGLAEAGAEVVVNGRKRPGVDRALAALARAVPGGVFRGVAGDLGTAKGCGALGPIFAIDNLKQLAKPSGQSASIGGRP